MANLDSFLGGLKAGNDIAEMGRSQRNRAMIGNLAPAIVGGDPQAFARAAAVDPAAAKDLQASGEGLMKRTRGAAQYLESALKSGNEAQIAAARRSVKPFMDSLKPGASYPMDMDPQQELAGIQSFLAQTAHLDPTLAKGTPTDVRSFQLMTQGLSPEDQERARRINLGLDGRASSSGFSQVKFTDAEGRERIGVLNGKTGQIDLPDGTSFNPQTGAISQTPSGAMPMRGDMEADIQLANEMIAAGIPDTQVDAFLAQRGQRAQAPVHAQAPMQRVGGDVFTGRRKEDEAAAIEAAKQGVQLANLPTELGMRNAAEIARTSGVEQAKAGVERETKMATRARDANDALGLIAEARRLLPNATGGGLAAVGDKAAGLFGIGTAGAQANAALKTISGQLTAKQPRMEGPQSDRDVQMYKDMAGDVANENLPVSIRMAALDQIERLQKKYTQGNQQRPGPNVGAVEDGYRFKGGNPADSNNWERL